MQRRRNIFSYWRPADFTLAVVPVVAVIVLLIEFWRWLFGG